MSDKDFVFRIGPMGEEKGAVFLYYVYPGQPNNYTFPANEDKTAWTQIGKVYSFSDLTCEPLLAANSPPEVTEEPFDVYTEYAAALMVYDNLADRPLRNVKEEGMIPDLVRASRDYLDRLGPAEESFQGICARFSGEPGIRTTVDVCGGVSPKEEIRFEFRDLDIDGNRIVDSSAERLSFGVRFSDGPEFASDALCRALRIRKVPLPFVGRPGNMGTVNDTILMLLIAALTALEKVVTRNDGAEGRYTIGNIDVLCHLTR